MIEKLSDSIIRFKIDDYQIMMEELGEGRGKIIITRWDSRNYSYYWGSMGESLNQFIKSINGDYFANALVPYDRCWTFDMKETVKSLKQDLEFLIEKGAFRRHLYKEFDELIHCDDMHGFDAKYSDIIQYNVNFDLIKDRWDRESIEANLKDINTFGYYQTSHSNEYNDVVKLHGKIVKHLNKYGEKKVK